MKIHEEIRDFIRQECEKQEDRVFNAIANILCAEGYVAHKEDVKEVFEKALAGYVKYLDRYIYFDKDGTVVESSDVLTAGIPQVTGIVFSGIQVGKPLSSDDTDIFARTLDLTKLLGKYELSADRIHFHENGEVTVYFGNARVDLGTDEAGIEDKVMLLGTFLERVGNLSGVLDMEEYSEEGIYVFTPDDTN